MAIFNTYFRANVHCCKVPNIEVIIYLSSHADLSTPVPSTICVVYSISRVGSNCNKQLIL